ncbi:hypothetical protein WMY93_004728 [Mugilogobius chulae]|uniref:Gypsy retrotransposon integrase-like protein 1 n=1 Tax=Mugilogobius chulae TaxID=88201 RepID=A0AAW0PPE8_9GOBI
MATSIPPPEDMKLTGDVATNWDNFRTEFEDYSLASGLAEKDKKVQAATLRRVMGSECRHVYKHNLTLSAEQQEDVKAILDALESYFKPKRNVIFERFVFGNCKQDESEPIDSFVTRLREKAASCEYGELREELIRDRLVLGISDESVRRRLLREKDLTLTSAIDICRAAEMTDIKLKLMTQDRPLESVHATNRRQQRPLQRTDRSQDTQRVVKDNACKYCGGAHQRGRDACPAFGKACRRCGTQNHFAKVCMKKARPDQRVNIADELTGEDEDADNQIYSVETIGAVNGQGKKWFATLKINGNLQRCQLDSGATCNVMSIKDKRRLAPSIPLLPSKARLLLYSGESLNSIGIFRTECVVRGKSHMLDFEIVRCHQRPLLSGTTSVELGLMHFTIPHELNKIDQNHSVPLTKQQLIDKFADVFSGPVQSLPGEVHFELDSSVTPVQASPRNVPVALRSAVKAQLDKHERDGHITPVSEPTDWISNMVIVRQPEKLRICIDPKSLNQALRRSHYQMPTLDDVLYKLPKARVFTLVDARDAFLQCKLDRESSYMTTFWTPWGRYRWLKLPFGVSVAPEVYQRKQHELLSGLSGVEPIADDILIVGCGETDAEAMADHDAKLIALLERCSEIKLRLSIRKLQFKVKEVKFHGHILSAEGLRPDPEKIRAVQDMPHPTDAKAVQRFIGFVTYLAKFLPRLSEVCEPLRRLLDKDVMFHWLPKHDAAVEEIKRLVTVAPVLKYYDVTKPVTIQSDASQKGLGCCLLQDGQPVGFASRALTQTEQNYAQIEKECLSIVFACQRFHHYLYGREEVTAETDHKPLISIFSKPLLSAPKRLQSMLLTLQNYNLKRAQEAIESINQSDYLNVTSQRLAQIRKHTDEDTCLQMLKTVVLQGWPEHKDETPIAIREYWSVRDEISAQNGVLFKGQRVIIPKSLRPEMLKRIHISHIGGEACYRQARDTLYWPNMQGEIKDFVSQCSACNEHSHRQQQETMMSHALPTRPWQILSMDLYRQAGKDYLIMVDHYSDFWEIEQLSDLTAETTVYKCKMQFARYGQPDRVITDCGSQFDNETFRKFAREWGFEHVMSSPRHPKSNGKAESAVKIVKNLSKRAASAGTDPWLAILQWRNTPTDDMHCSPAQRLMARRLKTSLPVSDTLLQPCVVNDVAEKIKARHQRAKLWYDRSAKDLPELRVGQSIRMQPLPGDRTGKWRRGLCLQQVGPRSYLVDVDGTMYRRNRVDLRPAEQTASERSQTNQAVVQDTLEEASISGDKDTQTYNNQEHIEQSGILSPGTQGYTTNSGRSRLPRLEVFNQLLACPHATKHVRMGFTYG